MEGTNPIDTSNTNNSVISKGDQVKSFIKNKVEKFTISRMH
jgi:hypothetical protein